MTPPANLTQITVLALQPKPLVVFQDRGMAILINTGTAKASKYQVLSFLTSQGINQIDYGVDINSQTDVNWSLISDRLKIKHYVTYSPNNELVNQVKAQEIVTKSARLSYENQLSALRLETTAHIWLILTDLEPNKDQIARYLEQANNSAKPLVLVTKNMSPAWLQLEPQVIISRDKLPENFAKELDKVKLLNLKRDGAIYWTTNHLIQPVIYQEKQGEHFF